MSRQLFEQIVTITEEYLGPAARRFVARQISSHLDKSPDEIVYADIPKLAEWIKVTLALITEDADVIAEYIQKLSQLTMQETKS